MPDFGSLLRFLELNAGIWFALALACAIIVFADRLGLPKEFIFDGNILYYSRIGLIIFGSLCAVSIIKTVMIPINFMRKKFRIYSMKRKERLRVIEELKNLTSKEYEILSYLVTRNEKNFNANVHGGSAAGLLGRRLVHRTVRNGHTFHVLSCPFTVDNTLWDVLMERRDEFIHHNPDGPSPQNESLF